MKQKTELKTGFQYIIKTQWSVLKIEVLEVTKTSVFYEILDNEHRVRMLIDDFKGEYDVLEEINVESIKVKWMI